jgi:hypothetical protein
VGPFDRRNRSIGFPIPTDAGIGKTLFPAFFPPHSESGRPNKESFGIRTQNAEKAMTRTNFSVADTMRIARAGLWTTAMTIALLAGTASSTAGALAAAVAAPAPSQSGQTLGNGWGG